MSTTHTDLTQVIRDLRPKLPEALRNWCNIQDVTKAFRCPNPAHDDRHPSCGLVPASRGEVFKCLSCEATGNIFNLAHYVWGKPTSGPAFVAALKELADEFGVRWPEEGVELTAEQVREMDIYSCAATISRIIATTTRLTPVVKRAIEEEYRFTDRTRKALGIGGVESREWLINLLVNQHGYTHEFLEQTGFDDKSLFRPECLIYTIKDETGNPVGFGAKNLLSKERKQEYEAAAAQYGKDSEQARRIWVPTKYVNTRETDHKTAEPRNTVYRKRTRMFGFNIAKGKICGQRGDSTLPLYIMEGYADVATAFNVGIETCAALGSCGLTDEMIDLIFSLGVKRVVFVLDCDLAGKKGTDANIERIEARMAGHVGIRVEIISIPEGEDDPDAFIRKYGKDAFLALPRMDIFDWRLARVLEEGREPEVVVEKTLPLIVNEPSHPRRYDMAGRLAERTGYPLSVVWGEVERMTSAEEQRRKQVRAAITAKYVKRLSASPDTPDLIAAEMVRELESVQAQAAGYRPGASHAHVENVLGKQLTTVDDGALKTGWPIFDRKFGGIPKQDAFISVPGKPNHSKSSFVCNLVWRLVDHNEELTVIYHCVDDSMEEFLPRIQGSRANRSSQLFKAAGASLQDPAFAPVYQEQARWAQTMVEQERLVLYDMTDIPKDMVALGAMVRDVRARFPQRPIVVVGDNFHHYDIPAERSEGEARQKAISRYAKEIAVTHHVTLIMTMEVPKEFMRNGVRPRLASIKGSTAMMFDVNANIGVYNDCKDFGSGAAIYWSDPRFTEERMGPNGEVLSAVVKLPVIELVFDKSKIFSGFDGSIFFRLTPESGRYDECSVAEQEEFSNLASQPSDLSQGDRSPQRYRGSGRPAPAPKPAVDMSAVPHPIVQLDDAPF